MIEVSMHALERSGQRIGLTVSEAQVMLKTVNTVQLNDPKDHAEFNGFRLFFHDQACAFFVGVYVFSITETEFRPTVVKTVLPLEWYERDVGPVSDKKKSQAVVKALAGRPVAIRERLVRLGLNPVSYRRFLVCSPTGRTSEIRLKGSVCPGFFERAAVEDVCKHPGVLTRLREGCAELGFELENRRWIRFAGGQIGEPMHRLNAQSAEACTCCGASPLPTDLPIPEKTTTASTGGSA